MTVSENGNAFRKTGHIVSGTKSGDSVYVLVLQGLR